jgi:hypothetical protein
MFQQPLSSPGHNITQNDTTASLQDGLLDDAISSDRPGKSKTSRTLETTLHKRRSYKDRVGIQGLAILAVGTLCLVAAPAILGLLWRGSMLAARGDNPGEFWESVVFSNWATRTVTICAAVVRASVGFQGGIFTAMIASLVLERVGARLEHAPLLAMIRSFNVSPDSLISPSAQIPDRALRVSYATAVVVGKCISELFFLNWVIFLIKHGFLLPIADSESRKVHCYLLCRSSHPLSYYPTSPMLPFWVVTTP